MNREIDLIFDFLTDGEESLQNQIRKTVEKYGQTATETASQFNNMQ